MAKSDSKEDMKMDMAQDKKIIKKAFGMHDKQEHKGEKTNLDALKKGGNVKKMAMGGPSSLGQLAMRGGNQPGRGMPMRQGPAPRPVMAQPALVPQKPGAPAPTGLGTAIPQAGQAPSGLFTAIQQAGQAPSGLGTAIPQAGQAPISMTPQYAAQGGKVKAKAPAKKMASGGKVSSASSRADGCATKGKTKGTMIAMCGGGMYKKGK